MNLPIIFIGPVTAGKSTQCKLVAEALQKESISLDYMGATKYYPKVGWDKDTLLGKIEKEGYLKTYLQWRTCFAHVIKQVLKDYPNEVIDFGAGHSHYDEPKLFEEVQKILVPYKNIILLLPSPDLNKSEAILKARCLEQRKQTWIRDGHDFINHWVHDDDNHLLATRTVYTKGKTLEETREEILEGLV